MITPEEKFEIRKVCRLIKADCETDVASSEGAPFTGAEIGKRLGEIYATFSTLAGMIEKICPD